MLRFLPAIAFLIAISCAICANFAFMAMFGEVNMRRPDDKQFRASLMLPSAYFTVWREYRLAHPKGSLATAFIALLSIFILLMLLAFMSFVWVQPFLSK
jgi:CDP-diglyceride synthetase